MRALAGGAAALAAVALLAACGSVAPGAGNDISRSAVAKTGRIDIVAVENVWGDIVRQLGGDRVAVTSVISDPEADPHTYETNASMAAAIAQARFVVANGAGYDDFVSKLLAANPNATRTTLTVADIVGATSGDTNPHLWYSTDVVARAATAIEHELESLQPSAAGAFRANLATFLAAERTDVVGVIQQIKLRYAGSAIAYTERVPGYLVEAAGLRLGIPASFARSIEDGNDPSPRDTVAFRQALEHHTVRALLYNAQVTSPTTVSLRQLATAHAVPVVAVTETLPPGMDFQTWQGRQAAALLKALGG